MGMPGGSLEQLQRDTDASAAELLAGIVDCRRSENVTAAQLVHRLHELVELRLSAEADTHHLGGEPDVVRAQKAAECEAAVALRMSRTVTRDMLTVAAQLAWRLPAVDAAFTAGDLDYPRVRIIALVLSKASDDTVRAVESDVLAAALRCSTASLRDRIWAHWIVHDEAEAIAAKKVAESQERCADFRRGNDGMAGLFAKMTLLEGAECDSILEELAGTVCPRDPRTKRQLRGHALVALIHREEYIACLCGQQACPVRDAKDFAAKRRPHLLQIMVGIESLLGLTSEPATLGDGSVLDPETVRTIAADARWQILLTDVLDAARAQAGAETAPPNADREGEAEMGCEAEMEGEAETESKAGGAEPTGAEHTEDEDAGDGDETDDGDDGDDGDVGDCPARAPDIGPTNTGNPGKPRAFRIIARGRTRPAASLPETSQTTAGSTTSGSTTSGSTTAGRDVLLSASIAAFLAAAAENPSLAQGIFPDGHGGYLEPPKGALTYKPSAELVAITRATHCTCTFPGCSVPAARCEIDHVVPFDHADPLAGGWTIASNLQPLCHFHHQAKTMKLWAAAKLHGDGVFWTSTSGLRRITPSTYGTVMVPEKFVHNRSPRPQPDPNCAHYYENEADPSDNCVPTVIVNGPADDLYEPTWWENNISEDNRWGGLLNTDDADYVPSLGNIARLKDPRAREEAIFLRERFLEHRAIVAARERYRPPPF